MPYGGRIALRAYRARWATDLIDSLHHGVVPVTSEGAHPDLADNKDAFQRAANRLGDNGTLLVPPGLFKLSAFPKLPSNSSLVGFGPPSRITFTEAIDIGITNDDHTNGNSNIFISGLNLDGSDLCNDPIELNNATDCIIDHVWVTQGNHDGIELQSCTRCIVSECIAHDSKTFNGIELDSCTDCTIADCIVYDNINGFEIDGTSNRCHIQGGTVRNNSGRGVSFNENTTNCSMWGTHPTGNGTDVVDGGTDNAVAWSPGSNLHIANSNYKAGYLFQPCPNSAVADSNISPNRFSVWLDGNDLTFRIKKSDSSLVTATLTAST